MADAAVSKTVGATRAGSTPAFGIPPGRIRASAREIVRPYPMTVKSKRTFWTKNIGPLERMIWSLVGLILMAIGFEVFHALTETGIGLVFVFVGFLVFLQAPLAWSLLNAIQGRSTFEKEFPAD